MSDLGTSVSLLTAIIDLKVVQSITKAISANTLKMGGVKGPLGNIESPKPANADFVITPEPRYESRRVFHPTPRIEVREVHHHRVVERPALAGLDQPLPPEQTAPSSHSYGSLPPPWRMPLPIAQPPVINIVKYEVQPPDLVCKGMLIDMFI